MNFNVLRDSCSESHFRGPWPRVAGIEVDDGHDELSIVDRESS